MNILPLLLLCLAAISIARACGDHSDVRSHASFSPAQDMGKEEFQSPLTTLESILVAQPNAKLARRNLKYLTSKPHMAGTRQDRVLAQFMVNEFDRFGFDRAWLDPVPALLSYPKLSPRVAILPKSKTEPVVELKLSEDLLDSTSDVWDRNHTSLGYSPSGNVTAQLVYANFGTPEDFAFLEQNGVRVRGNIVLVRYGKCFRGLKVRNAQVRGAAGVLIYSDPKEDGYAVGKTYPEGAWRPQSSVQRGSVHFNALCAGDPARKASASSVEEICGYREEELVPQIPALPLAWEDALPLLKLLNGQGPAHVPSSFVGALPNVTYQTGPSRNRVLMQVSNQDETRLIWNAFGLIKGRYYADAARDRPVILGNHRDAWVFGAVDPNSGTASMLEVARAFSALLKLGWRPRRTILFASWSGEELGLLGSTAFGENNAERWILKQAIAYVNVDVGVSGKVFQLGATATLARMVRQVLQDLPDPEFPQQSLIMRWPNNQTYSQLGTGSDYTVFIHHLGIPSLDMRFAPPREKAGQYGVYHSDFDSFDWMDRQGDPGFVFHQAMASIWSLVAMRLADGVHLPFHHYDQAVLVQGFVRNARDMVREDAAFQAMVNASNEYAAAAFRSDLAIWRDQRHDDRKAFSERLFLHRAGLPLRKWFRHVLHAPSYYLGYASDVLPGVTQAFRDFNDPALAVEQAYVFAKRLRAVARFLSE